MNLIPLGGGANNIYGVQTASRYYFNKDAKDVTVAEAAYIAGITSAPNRYNPFDEKTDRSETINKKIKVPYRKLKKNIKVKVNDENTLYDVVKMDSSDNKTLYIYLQISSNKSEV